MKKTIQVQQKLQFPTEKYVETLYEKEKGIEKEKGSEEETSKMILSKQKLQELYQNEKKWTKDGIKDYMYRGVLATVQNVENSPQTSFESLLYVLNPEIQCELLQELKTMFPGCQVKTQYKYMTEGVKYKVRFVVDWH